MATSRLSLPSRKLLIADVQSSRLSESNTEISGLKVWEFSSSRPHLSMLFSIVWLQGRVVDTKEGGTSFDLQDDSGILKVEKPTNVVQTKKATQRGQYVLVIGEVLEIGHHAVVKAMKIQDLTQDFAAQKLWPQEVTHSKIFLASHYSHGIVTLET